MAQHWARLYPPPVRERGRAGSFAWLAEKLTPAVQARQPSQEEGPFVRMSLDDLGQLEPLLALHFIKFPVSLRPLVDALETHLQSVGAAEAQATVGAEQRKPRKGKAARAAGEAPPVIANDDSAAAEPHAGSDAPAESGGIADQALDGPPGEAECGRPAEAEAADPIQSAFSSAGQAAAQAIAIDPTDAQAYLAARFAAWGPIRLAPTTTDGVTALPPPDKAMVGRIADLRKVSDTRGLVLACEDALRKCPLWLDTQFMLAQALDAAGADYAAARASVVAELGAFLRRVDDLLDLRFRDGTPFAGPDACAWIRQAVLSGAEGEVDRLKKVVAEAGRLGRSGAVLEGLRLLADHADRAPDARRRFAARIKLGEYCLEFKLLRPLFPLLEDLQETAKERAIESWEPQLVGSLLSLSWRAYSHREAERHVATAELEERKALIVAALARINVAEAAELSCSAQT